MTVARDNMIAAADLDSIELNKFPIYEKKPVQKTVRDFEFPFSPELEKKGCWF